MMEKIRVLVADDMNVIAEMIKEELEGIEGIEVVGISNDGQDECDKIFELQPDLVFTDNQMPKLNGIEVIKLVRNSILEKKPNFIIVTGDRDISFMDRVNSLEVIKVLNKPIINGEVEKAVQEYRLKNKSKKEQRLEINNELLHNRIQHKENIWRKILKFF